MILLRWHQKRIWLSNLVDKDVVKKSMCDKLIIKVNAVDTLILIFRLVTKTQYDSGKQGIKKKIEDVDKKIPNINGPVKKADYNAKITEIENKMPSVTYYSYYCCSQRKCYRDWKQ